MTSVSFQTEDLHVYMDLRERIKPGRMRQAGPLGSPTHP